MNESPDIKLILNTRSAASKFAIGAQMQLSIVRVPEVLHFVVSFFFVKVYFIEIHKMSEFGSFSSSLSD